MPLRVDFVKFNGCPLIDANEGEMLPHHSLVDADKGEKSVIDYK